jgi:hypothetical protein
VNTTTTMYFGRRFRRRRRRIQRGRGWGNWLGGISRIAKRALPFLKNGAKAVGKQALSTITEQAVNSSMGFLDDVLDGENVLDSVRSRLKEGSESLRHTAKTRAKEGALDLARAAKRKLSQRAPQQEGSGRKKRKKWSKKGSKKTRKVAVKGGKGKAAVKRGKKKRGGKRGREEELSVIQSRALERERCNNSLGSYSASLPYRHIFTK